jgi:hypothetical protein
MLLETAFRALSVIQYLRTVHKQIIQFTLPLTVRFVYQSVSIRLHETTNLQQREFMSQEQSWQHCKKNMA